MASDGGVVVPIAKEVQEIIMICMMGIVVYIVMVCCILCRKPATLAIEFDVDVDETAFVARRPEDPEGFYFAQSEQRVVMEACAGHCGRFIVDRGQVEFCRANGVRANLTRLTYGVFSANEKYTFSGADDEFLFHLDLFRGDLREKRPRKENGSHAKEE